MKLAAHIKHTIFGCFLLSLFCLASADSALPEMPIKLTPAEYNQINNREIIVKITPCPKREGVWFVQSAGIVDAPARKIWDMLTDITRYREIYPDILEYRVTRDEGNRKCFYSLLNYPWPLENRSLISDVTYHPDTFHIYSKRIGGTVVESETRWRYYPLGSYTLIYYEQYFNPGLEFLPDWVLGWATKKMVPKIIKRIQELFPCKKNVKLTGF